MAAITEAEEKKIDKGTYHVPNNDIFFYGEVDLNKEEDLMSIRDFNLVSRDGTGMIYTRFNYKAGTFDLIDGQVKWGPTSDPIEWFKFNHCRIGKPKRVIVYKGW